MHNVTSCDCKGKTECRDCKMTKAGYIKDGSGAWRPGAPTNFDLDQAKNSPFHKLLEAEEQDEKELSKMEELEQLQAKNQKREKTRQLVSFGLIACLILFVLIIIASASSESVEAPGVAEALPSFNPGNFVS